MLIGVLRMPHGDSPASMSIHDESTIVSEGSMMAVFNNLVMFDQHIPQNRLDTIVPDLAVEWSWSEDGMTLIFKLQKVPPDRERSRATSIVVPERGRGRG